MNLSMKWLGEFVDTSSFNDIKDFCEKITISGSKVEKFEIEGKLLNKVVTGKVLSIEKHPNADKLVICQVDVGKDSPIQIVTGAKNLKVNDIVPVALDGSTLTNGTKIKKGKLRGILSNGMMCSLQELGLTKNDFPYAIEDGIFVLNEPCELGQDIREVIGFNDIIVEFEITPNRPDCLSIIGLAREVSATFDKTLKLHDPIVKAESNKEIKLNIENLEENLCPYYNIRVVRNVKIGPSPRFIRERLRAMGIKPINNIVDITNYVMLEYGQPMHAFDLKNINENKLVIRLADAGEKITTLDGVERNLSSSNLIITDAKGPLAIAGVMGGSHSGISYDTVDVVFESANFNGSSVRNTAKEHNLRTDSSSRFEKGLDKFLCRKALDRACELVEILKIGEVCKNVYSTGNLDDKKRIIKLDCDFINKFLNISLTKDEMTRILEKIGCEIVGEEVLIPTHRNDLENKYDLAEEIARFYGYDKIPTTCLRGSSFGYYTKEQIFDKKIKQIMLALGLSEVMTYTFISPKHYSKLLLNQELMCKKSVRIANPLGEDTSVMRASAVPSMIDLLSRNFNNKNSSVSFFEIAKEYENIGSQLPLERQKLIAGFYGDNVDFLSVKGIIEEFFNSIKIKNYDIKATKDVQYYHPGRCAEFFINEKSIGYLGEIHPTVLENYNIKTRAYIFEFSVKDLFLNSNSDVEFIPIPKFPAVKRDLALVCDENLPVFELKKIIIDSAGDILEDAELFDIYIGEQIEKGKKSVAFNISLRSKESTLSEEQVSATMKRIVKAFEKIGVKLR